MKRYAFIHTIDGVDVFIVEASNKENAIRVFIKRIRGKFGFFNELRRRDILEDVSLGSLTIKRVTEVR
jgi:hypothetical protein